MSKNKSKSRGDIAVIFYLIFSFVASAVLLRIGYAEKYTFPSGDVISKVDVGMGEVFAPVWIPFVFITETITYGISR